MRNFLGVRLFVVAALAVRLGFSAEVRFTSMFATYYLISIRVVVF
jgi:hypothetical protein